MSLSKCYSSLLDSMNAEIRIRWLQIVVRNDYYPDLHRVRRFLENQVQLHARDMTGGRGTASPQGPISAYLTPSEWSSGHSSRPGMSWREDWKPTDPKVRAERPQYR